MKKVALLAVVAALAFGAKAELTWGNYVWTDDAVALRPEDGREGAGTVLSEQKVYLYYGYAADFADVLKKDLKTMWSDDDFTSYNKEGVGGFAGYFKTDTDGKGIPDEMDAVQLKKVMDATAPYYYLAVLDDLNPLQYFLSDSFQPGSIDEVINAGTVLASISDGAKWAAQTVPEPTAGLLLLLGFAGLALRRRSA